MAHEWVYNKDFRKHRQWYTGLRSRRVVIKERRQARTGGDIEKTEQTIHGTSTRILSKNGEFADGWQKA